MQTYSVRSGDTLSALAKRFGTSVSEIAKANNIRPTAPLKIGDRLTRAAEPAQPRDPRESEETFRLIVDTMSDGLVRMMTFSASRTPTAATAGKR